MALYNNFILGGLFILCASLIWIFGVKLAKAVDVVVNHYGWGEAIGGMLFLAIIADLPEIAITAFAALAAAVRKALPSVVPLNASF